MAHGARVAELGQRRKVEGLVTQVFGRSNRLPRTFHPLLSVQFPQLAVHTPPTAADAPRVSSARCHSGRWGVRDRRGGARGVAPDLLMRGRGSHRQTRERGSPPGSCSSPIDRAPLDEVARAPPGRGREPGRETTRFIPFSRGPRSDVFPPAIGARRRRYGGEGVARMTLPWDSKRGRSPRNRSGLRLVTER